MAIIMGKGCIEAIYGLMGWNLVVHHPDWYLKWGQDIHRNDHINHESYEMLARGRPYLSCSIVKQRGIKMK